MAVSECEVAHFAQKYFEATRNLAKGFVCPITLQDEPDNAELCDGHILCDGIKSAKKATIVQRKDVDNRFGSLIERDFVTFANLRTATPGEMLRAAKDLIITSPTGERMPAFFSGPTARVRFQQLELYDEEGKTIATPFLRSHTLDDGRYRQLEVEWMFYIHKHCFTAAMLKSAYLTLFQIFGYHWVFDGAGDKVRRALVAGITSPDRKTALDQFAGFAGCCWVAGNDMGKASPDTLSDGRMLFHYSEGDATVGILFGISTVFWINGALIAVTLPACNRIGHHFVSLKYYEEFIGSRQVCHNIHLARMDEDILRVDPSPLSLKRVDNSKGNMTVLSELSPCPTSSLVNTDITPLLRV
jgi:hypothetical protein